MPTKKKPIVLVTDSFVPPTPPAPPPLEPFLIRTDDVLSPMLAASNTLEFVEELFAALVQGDSDNLSIGKTSLVVLSETICHRRRNLDRAIKRVRSIGAALLVPDPQQRGMAEVSQLLEARQNAEGGTR